MSYVLEVVVFLPALPTEEMESRIGAALALLAGDANKGDESRVVDIRFRQSLKHENKDWMPLRVHFDGRPCVNKHVRGLTKLTKNWAEVTCRRCLKHRPRDDLALGPVCKAHDLRNCWECKETKPIRVTY